MTGWTAIVPFKPAGMRKTRLAAALDERERDALSMVMFAHVTAVLAAAAEVEEILLLARARPAGWAHSWGPDEGRGLNAELAATRRRCGARRLLVIHADLPFVRPEDITALLAQADEGCTVAPDRHGAGTNALALMDCPAFDFCFGAGSLALHVASAEAGAGARVVDLPGLAFDIDTMDDYEEAKRRGWPPARP